jgi:hypothetical protein
MPTFTWFEVIRVSFVGWAKSPAVPLPLGTALRDFAHAYVSGSVDAWANARSAVIGAQHHVGRVCPPYGL